MGWCAVVLLVLRALLVDGSEASPVVGRHMYGSKALVRSRGGSGNGSSTQLKNLAGPRDSSVLPLRLPQSDGSKWDDFSFPLGDGGVQRDERVDSGAQRPRGRELVSNYTRHSHEGLRATTYT
jgi:hypothetical protein